MSESILQFVAPQAFPLPRKVFAAVLKHNNILPGSRVLDVGCPSSSLTERLQQLGVDAVGWHAVAPNRGDTETIVTQPTFPDYGNERAFDAIIIREHSEYNESLSSLECQLLTAQLMASLRPTGSLSFIQECPATLANSHQDVCWEKLFSSFPGSLISEHISVNSLWSNKRQAFELRQFRIPAEQIEAAEWNRIATSALVHNTTCCDWAARKEVTRRAA